MPAAPFRPLVVLPLVATVAVGGGCASVTPGLAATGEPLEARTRTVRVPAEIKDNGDIVPAWDRTDLAGHLQGAAPIDELDFFHIAGDTEAEARIVKWREGYNTAILVGSPVVALGVASFAGAAGVYLLNRGESDLGFTDTPEGQLTVGLSFAGAVLMGGGTGLFYWLVPAPIHGEPIDFIQPRDRALTAAETYNATLSSSSASPASSPP